MGNKLRIAIYVGKSVASHREIEKGHFTWSEGWQEYWQHDFEYDNYRILFVNDLHLYKAYFVPRSKVKEFKPAIDVFDGLAKRLDLEFSEVLTKEFIRTRLQKYTGYGDFEGSHCNPDFPPELPNLFYSAVEEVIEVAPNDGTFVPIFVEAFRSKETKFEH